MRETPPVPRPDEIDQIFAKLNPQDIEQFYAGYQQWAAYQQIACLQEQLESLHQQIAENTQRLQQAQPSAIALAILAQLQSNGVTDIELLDRMLARGENWLDRTMQRLVYCEQQDFMGGNYSQWCEHALEGAYDWIDSMLDASSPSPPPSSSPDAREPFNEATEEQFLQKLMSDEAEDEDSLLETTLKMPAISLSISGPDAQGIQPEQGTPLPDLPDAQIEQISESRAAGAPQYAPAWAATSAQLAAPRMHKVKPRRKRTPIQWVFAALARILRW